MQSVNIFQLECVFLQFMFYMVLSPYFHSLNSPTKTCPYLRFKNRVLRIKNWPVVGTGMKGEVARVDHGGLNSLALRSKPLLQYFVFLLWKFSQQQAMLW